MKPGRFLAVSILGLCLCLLLPATVQAWDQDYSENRTSVAVYGGVLTPQDSTDLYTGPSKFVDSWIWALSVSRELFSVGHAFDVSWLRPLKLEAELVNALHTSHWPTSQTFYEGVGSLNLRWHHFPWNRHVLTTMGFGEGLSYASIKPEYEVKINNKTANFLNYLMFDVTFAHPEMPQVALMFRWHHRSGIFGLMENVMGGSDIFTAGLKYSF